MGNELISVIMSAYNESPEWIRKSIESILNQTYQNLQFIIILDKPENEELKQLIQEYADSDERISFYINEKNMGLVRSLNRALGYVKGQYVARMDADDIAYENRLEVEMDYMKKNHVDFVMASVDFLDENDVLETNTFDKAYNPKTFAKIQKYGNVSAHPTWLLKKEVYDELHGYREVDSCEDCDFIYRALQKGFQIARVSDHLLKYRIRSTGISRSRLLEQFTKFTYLRTTYRKGKSVSRLKKNELEQLYEMISEKEKEAFDKAVTEFWDAKKLIPEKKYGKAIGMISHALFTSREFRKYAITNEMWAIMTHII